MKHQTTPLNICSCFSAWYERHPELLDQTNDADDELDELSDDDFVPIGPGVHLYV